MSNILNLYNQLENFNDIYEQNLINNIIEMTLNQPTKNKKVLSKKGEKELKKVVFNSGGICSGFTVQDIYNFSSVSSITACQLAIRNCSVGGTSSIGGTSNTTTAPAGSVSCLTQTTSGIEPAFMLYYKRRKKVQNGEEVMFVDDLGDEWTEFNVYHHAFKQWMDYWKLFDNEVESVIPLLVPDRNISDPEIYRSVSYDRVCAYIVNALKEIKQRLEDLESNS